MSADMSVFAAGNVAVISGSSSGIGLGMARKCAEAGMHVYLVDRDEQALAAAETEVAARGAASCVGVLTDVSRVEEVERAKQAVLEQHSTVHLLFANAGTGDGGNALAPLADWESTIGTNMWGVIYMCQAFVPAMLEGQQHGIVINTASKQGITLPPGTALSYNVSKAAVKAYTEGLQHELREMDSKLTAHVMIPAMVYSAIGWKSQRDTRARRAREEALAQGGSEAEADEAARAIVLGFDINRVKYGEHVPDAKPADAWTGDETADFIMERLASGSCACSTLCCFDGFAKR